MYHISWRKIHGILRHNNKFVRKSIRNRAKEWNRFCHEYVVSYHNITYQTFGVKQLYITYGVQNTVTPWHVKYQIYGRLTVSLTSAHGQLMVSSRSAKRQLTVSSWSAKRQLIVCSWSAQVQKLYSLPVFKWFRLYQCWRSLHTALKSAILHVFPRKYLTAKKFDYTRIFTDYVYNILEEKRIEPECSVCTAPDILIVIAPSCLLFRYWSLYV
jgi:hypothetical protein